MYIFIRMFLIPIMIFVSNAEASYVIYNQGSETTSIPYTGSGFYYSDQSGNSMEYREIHNVPVVINQYPNATWISVNNENIPGNAIVLQYINGYPVFYCRIKNANGYFYGKLFP